MLIKHQAVKMYGPCCLGYGTMVLSGSRSSRLTSGTQWVESWVGTRTDLDGVENTAILTLTGNRCPVRSLPGFVFVVQRELRRNTEIERLERGYCLSKSHDPWKQA